jgi:hypothetical protein
VGESKHLKETKVILALILFVSCAQLGVSLIQGPQPIRFVYLNDSTTVKSRVESVTLKVKVEDTSTLWTDKTIDTSSGESILIHGIRWRRDGTFNSGKDPYEVIAFLFSGTSTSTPLSGDLSEVELPGFIDGYWTSYAVGGTDYTQFGSPNLNTEFSPPKPITDNVLRLYVATGGDVPDNNYVIAVVDYEVMEAYP